MKHANFETLISSDPTKILVLRDLGPFHLYLTITNDAEWVVEYLHKNDMIRGRRVFYHDSGDEITELIISDGKFVGFGLGE